MAVSSATAVSSVTAVARAAAVASAVTVASAAALSVALWPRVAVAQSMFSAADLDPQRFVLVASPIGSSGRYQLNIYEQVNPRKPCFAIGAGKPAAVNPLLATFDFTGICSRYIDANGYSVRVGPLDLAGSYRLLVRSESGDTLLVALPTKTGAGPEMVVARAGGAASGFHKLDFEPGWRLMRRQFRGRNLGHVYLFNDSWPGVTSPGSAAAPLPAAGSPASGAAPVSPRPLSVVGPKATSAPPAAPSMPVPGSPAKAAPLPPLPSRL
ncbi:MAG: DUF3747 domain-containing protein [Cyanobium sp.]